MHRFALLAVLCLAACAKREEKQESTPPPAPPATNQVMPIEKGPASKFQGMPVQKPMVQHIPGKDPAPAASSAAPSAK